MKRVIVLCLLLMFSIMPALSETTFYAETNRPNVNMRTKPDSKSSLVMKIKTKGTQLTVHDTATDRQGTTWYYVETQRGKRGYIQTTYLTATGTVSNPADSNRSQVSQQPSGNTGRGTWQDAYASFILNGEYRNWRGPTQYDQFYLNNGGGNIAFGLYDMNLDGIPELIATNGDDSMAGKTNLVFTWMNNAFKYAGTAGFREAMLVSFKSDSYPGLFCQDGNMGYYETVYFYLDNGKITDVTVRESDYNTVEWDETPEPKQITRDSTLYRISLGTDHWSLRQFSTDVIRKMGFNAFLNQDFLEYHGCSYWD